MPLIERARTSQVVVGSFFHQPGEAAAATEWWARGCVGFTDFGWWRVRSRRGSGAVTPGSVLVGAAQAEHDCHHPGGLDDRMLCVIYLRDLDPGPAVLVQQSPALRQTRRALAAALRLPGPDQDEVDALCLATLELCRDASGRPISPSAKAGRLVARLRAEAAARYTEPEFSLVAEAAALGVSRTRLVHVFQDVTGLTPHRYLRGLRTAHAARLLAETTAPVTEICFASGFGSMARFHVAFREAFGMTPTSYRVRCAGSGRVALSV
jgi:AraC-like DNA-binding protein